MVATRSSRNGRAGSDEDFELSGNARVVLERRYLAKDSEGRLIETPGELFRRVAHNLVQREHEYGLTSARVREVEEMFFRIMTRFEFLPNSPTLGNTGRPLQQLSACFVLPVEDSIEGIFETIKHTALIHQTGGGTGFAFSRLRPEGSMVKSTAGVASGPVSFMKVFDASTEAIKQGGTRRGANMAILAVDHPDIEKFINVKADMVTLTNFNISVAVTEKFMDAVERDADYDLVDPHSGAVVGSRNARRIFTMMVENAWKNGDPGMVFMDRMNATESNPAPKYGPIESTNPCGEQPLYPYDSCNLGSINLAKFVSEGPGGAEVDWDRLAAVIPWCARFLDNVIDMNRYPIPQIEEVTHQIRRIGLGVMGWADMLYKLRIPYDSDRGVQLAEEVMRFIHDHANRASEKLADERGTFPAWEDSIYNREGPSGKPEYAGPRYRNATRTTIAPTGTLSILADCSGGIEPVFALAFTRQHYLDRSDPTRPTRLTEVNKDFQRVAQEEGFHSDELIEYLADGGSLQERSEVPEWAKRVFVTAHDIAPDWHVRMQAAFQRWTDNAVSKTINFPHQATAEDVERAYLLAYTEGCKGITIYRDGSRDAQVLSTGGSERKPADEPVVAEPAAGGRPSRRRLPDERRALTHKFVVGEQEGYLTVGLYDDGRPGEIFLKISKEGSTVSGLMDAVAMMTSVSLQYGVPLENLCTKLKNTRFEPSGRTSNPEIPFATSLLDYVFRWLELKFVPPELRSGNGNGHGTADVLVEEPGHGSSSGLGCPDCGSILTYQEGCLVCRACGYNKCG